MHKIKKPNLRNLRFLLRFARADFVIFRQGLSSLTRTLNDTTCERRGRGKSTVVQTIVPPKVSLLQNGARVFDEAIRHVIPILIVSCDVLCERRLVRLSGCNWAVGEDDRTMEMVDDLNFSGRMWSETRKLGSCRCRLS